MKRLLYLTDLYYPAPGRQYYQEDLWIVGQLRKYFHIVIGHPQQALSFLNSCDGIVFRNTGPVFYYADYYRQFVAQVREQGIPIFNSLDGKGDMAGKDYLLDLFNEGYPVIPTVVDIAALDKLGPTEQYLVKMRDGADSIGMSVASAEELATHPPVGKLIQPLMKFQYEVSFYFINGAFHYALYTPDKTQRWKLTRYQPSSEDLQFAKRFITWNRLTRGIERVDAMRLDDGRLLLVELEDLNPYLSLDLLEVDRRQFFLRAFVQALQEL